MSDDSNVTSDASRVVVLGIVVVCLLLGGLIWGWRTVRLQSKCEREWQDIELVFSYHERLQLRDLMNGAGEAANISSWQPVRERVDDRLRVWSELRVRACMEKQVEVERCLDEQAMQFEALIAAWLAGDRSWATADLNELLPWPASCLPPSNSAVERSWWQ